MNNSLDKDILECELLSIVSKMDKLFDKHGPLAFSMKTYIKLGRRFEIVTKKLAE